MKRDIDNTEIDKSEATDIDNIQPKVVMGDSRSEIVEKQVVDHESTEPNSLANVKPCERSEDQKAVIRQAKRTYSVDQGGVVIFDRIESVDYAESIRHNR